MLRFTLTVLIALLAMASPVSGQDPDILDMPYPASGHDPVKIDSRHHAVVLESDIVRVLRSTYAPGERSPMHDHPPNVSVMLDDVHFDVLFPDGEKASPRMKAGRVDWGAGSTHELRNASDKNVRVMMVEFTNSEVAEGIRQRVSQPQPIELAPGMTGEALIDNDLVAVRRVIVTPGSSREPHASEERDLLVLPRVGTLTLTIGNQALRLEPGQAYLVEHGVVHGESNDTDEPIEWIALLLEHSGEHEGR